MEMVLKVVVSMALQPETLDANIYSFPIAFQLVIHEREQKELHMLVVYPRE
jgi:hypothetical protein